MTEACKANWNVGVVGYYGECTIAQRQQLNFGIDDVTFSWEMLFLAEFSVVDLL